ncbi:MAG: FAD-dependent monooxygenase [Actinobacteria bacterium]|nr:FAD-dependent monooxygenase [Actinomycetota bacterium]
MKRGELGVAYSSIQRNLLEIMVRERTQKVPNVTILDEATVTSFITDVKDKSKIIGVKYQRNGKIEEIYADMVADCGGANAPSHQLIPTQTGLPLEKTSVKSNLNYMGFCVEYEKNCPPTFLYYQPHPPNTHNGVILLPWGKKEINFTLITIGGLSRPPREIDQIEEYLKEYPRAYEMYKAGKIVRKPMPYAKDGSDYYHYEKTPLKGFVALGDAVASFNPVYGQGLTTGAESVFLLDYHLWKRN